MRYSKISAEQQAHVMNGDRITAQLLVNRGIHDTTEAEKFLRPEYTRDVHDPFLFRDMERAVDRIFRAVDDGEQIIIHGDYDADGVCGSAVLYLTLKKIGANVDVYIPHRDTEGYGLNLFTIQSLVDVGTNLIITVDCGISNVEEVAAAQEKGIDVIVTDHHSEPPELPKGYAILNPKIAGETYPFQYLAGVGVGFKVAQAIARRKNFGEAFEKWLLDIVATSTITDCVELLGENRVLTKFGLTVMRRNRRLGLRKLFEMLRLEPEHINEETIGFTIGPHINAAGRMKHANMAFEMLIADNDVDAERIARDLTLTNRERQTRSNTMTKLARTQAMTQTSESVIVVMADDWPVGLVGLVAGRISHEFHRPTFVITQMEDERVGSGRSIEHFNLVEAMQSMPELFRKYGGHPMACGFSLAHAEDVMVFTERMRARASDIFAGKDLHPTLIIESFVKFSDIHWSLIETLAEFAPFGTANPEPIFATRDVRIVKSNVMGNGDKHVRLTLEHNGMCLRAVAFGWGDTIDVFSSNTNVDIAYTIRENRWNGQRELQLSIVDMRLSSDEIIPIYKQHS